mmetsp:Transcript_143178/g.249704  ORF Transcript_143178/g.249704 Transcript_143178/m.249704 type:complete len:316 (+) Transcript_143178:46-993(+)
MAWQALLLAVSAAVALVHLADSAAAAAAAGTLARGIVTRKPGDVVQPKMVIPGEWLTDQAEHFLLLPLNLPSGLEAPQCKVLSNGDVLLVVVTEQPQEEPETNALRKFRLIMEAIKQEAGHDEHTLQQKLQTWWDTEDDDEVRVRVRRTLDSLMAVRQAKKIPVPSSVAVPLGLEHKASSSFLAKPARSDNATHSWPSAASDAQAGLHSLHQQRAHRSNLIKESFSIEIPYPVASDRIFILKTDPASLVVLMPLVRNSLEANGISTGGKPYVRLPVFRNDGMLLAGPSAQLNFMANGLDIASVTSRQGLKPLVIQ